MSDPADMQDGEYLVWGHDGGAVNVVYTEVPAGVPGRLARIWRVEETGDVGAVDISFDVSGAGVPIGGAGDVFLSVDNADSDFSDVVPIAASSLVGYVATFAGVNLASGAYLGLGVAIACAPYCNDFTVNGAATPGSLGCYELTPATGNQAGAVWFDSLANFTHPFHMEIDLYLGADDAGADGITFSLQNAGTAVLGGAGGGMGIGGVTPAFSVEFDTYQNGGEPAEDHISIFYNGGQGNVLVAPVSASATAPNVEDGDAHRVVFDWDPVAQTFWVYFDGILRATYTGNLVGTYFGGNPWLNFGMTAGTGGAVNVHSFCLIDLQGYFRDPLGTCAPYCDDFQTLANASVVGNGCYELTPATNYRAGAVWFDSLLNLQQPFNLEFNLLLGATDAGADGMTFTLQQKGCMDMGTGYQGSGGMTPSLSVEFDTYQNPGELADDHLSVYRDGNPATTLVAAVCAAPACTNIENGLYHNAVFNWDPATQTLTIYFDGALRATYTGNIVETIFGSNPWVYFGFTGSTGGSNNQQRICAGQLSGTFQAATDLFDGALPTDYTRNGSASGSRLTCVRVTDAANDQAGSAWYPTRVDLGYDFRIEFFHHAGNGEGADGSAFVLQSAAANTAALGGMGSNLGASGITPSVGIEFDIYDSSPHTGPEMADDHIAIFRDGDVVDRLTADACALPGCGDIEDGQYRRTVIDWDATSQTLEVYYGGQLRQTYTGNLISTVFGGVPLVYYGFTGGTGGLVNMQEFCIVSLNAVFEGTTFPVEWLSFEAVPVGEVVQLRWLTASERDNDYFTVERSRDGVAFEALLEVPSQGNIQYVSDYQAVDPQPYAGRSHYRLRQTDLNGTTSYSDRVEVYIGADNLPFALSAYPNPADGQHGVSLAYQVAQAGPSVLEVYNASGQRMLRRQLASVAGDNLETLEVGTWAAGVYMIRLAHAGQAQMVSLRID